MAVWRQVIGSSVDAASNKLFYSGTKTKFKGGMSALKGDTDYAKALEDATKTWNQRIKDLSPEERKALIDAGDADYTALQAAQANRADELTAGFKEMGGAAKDWITGQDAADMGRSRVAAIAKRGAALGASSVAVGSAGRALTGGDMMHNNRGYRDIAGIPFI